MCGTENFWPRRRRVFVQGRHADAVLLATSRNNAVIIRAFIRHRRLVAGEIPSRRTDARTPTPVRDLMFCFLLNASRRRPEATPRSHLDVVKSALALPRRLEQLMLTLALARPAEHSDGEGSS